MPYHPNSPLTLTSLAPVTPSPRNFTQVLRGNAHPNARDPPAIGAALTEGPLRVTNPNSTPTPSTPEPPALTSPTPTLTTPNTHQQVKNHPEAHGVWKGCGASVPGPGGFFTSKARGTSRQQQRMTPPSNTATPTTPTPLTYTATLCIISLMLALCVGTYANDTDVSVDRPAEIPTEITYTSYNTICSLLVPVIRGVFFRVAPPIYTRMCIYPTSNERSLGTFPVTGKTPTRSSAHLRRANSQIRPCSPPRECSGDACNPTRSLAEDLCTRTYNPSIPQTNVK